MPEPQQPINYRDQYANSIHPGRVVPLAVARTPHEYIPLKVRDAIAILGTSDIVLGCVDR